MSPRNAEDSFIGCLFQFGNRLFPILIIVFILRYGNKLFLILICGIKPIEACCILQILAGIWTIIENSKFAVTQVSDTYKSISGQTPSISIEQSTNIAIAYSVTPSIRLRSTAYLMKSE